MKIEESIRRYVPFNEQEQRDREVILDFLQNSLIKKMQKSN